jgi:hypothetical protein
MGFNTQARKYPSHHDNSALAAKVFANVQQQKQQYQQGLPSNRALIDHYGQRSV